MAAPAPRLRKEVSTPGLLRSVRRCFESVEDENSGDTSIPLSDVLMSGLAVFSLKYSSLLKFDTACHEEPQVRANLKNLFGVGHAPCDTQMRTRLDRVHPATLRPAFRAVHRQAQRHKVLEAYQYLNGHYLVSIDGTGQFASSAIHCPECCQKNTASGVQYYHQLLGAVLVHPELKTVLPMVPEPMTRQDGTRKNDCERNAAKRLLEWLRQDYPKLKFIVVEDALASNGPHIEQLSRLDLRYILGAKPGDHAALFAQVHQAMADGRCKEFTTIDDKGVERGYRWVNGLSLNKSSRHLRVNFLEHWEVKNGKQRIWTWVSDLDLNRMSVEAIARAGRTRWKIENETFNTLKNQGYELEHNYGHGKQHLSTVFANLTMLAFLIDQVQELGCRMFQRARERYRSRTLLWERLRAIFLDFILPDWKTVWEVLGGGLAPVVAAPDTS